ILHLLLQCDVTLHAPTRSHTLSLHDSLPICRAHWEANDMTSMLVLILTHRPARDRVLARTPSTPPPPDSTRRSVTESALGLELVDRKSTRLNSSHQISSYAVFCLKKTRRHNR